jgi:hypothetical protein
MSSLQQPIRRIHRSTHNEYDYDVRSGTGHQSRSGTGFTGNLGNIDAYISAVNRLPMLTHEEEIAGQAPERTE